jgi:hypothetical protein
MPIQYRCAEVAVLNSAKLNVQQRLKRDEAINEAYVLHTCTLFFASLSVFLSSPAQE